MRKKIVTEFKVPKGKKITIGFAFRGGQIFYKAVDDIKQGMELMDEVVKNIGQTTFLVLNSHQGPGSMIRLDEIQYMNFCLVDEDKYTKWGK